MSEQVQQLVPDSKHVMAENPTNRPLNKDEKEIVKIQNKIMNKIIIPILKKEYKKDPPLSDKKIKQFFKCCMKLSEITSRNSEAQVLAETTLMVYQRGIDKIQQNSVITSESKKEFIETTEILMDYTENITSMMSQRFVLLEKSMEQIDVEDLIQCLYGSILSFFCVYFLIDMPELQDPIRFTRIIEDGHDMANDLDGYIDTLDILTKPDEDAKIRKIE